MWQILLQNDFERVVTKYGFKKATDERGIESCITPLPFTLHPKSTVDHRLRLFHDAFQMILVTEALRIEFVDVFGSRRTRGEPSTLGDHLQTADGSVIARRAIEHALNLFAGEFAVAKLPGR